MTSICGPHPGINPIKIAINGTKIPTASNHDCKSNPAIFVAYSNNKNARITHAVIKLVSSDILDIVVSLGLVIVLILEVAHINIPMEIPIKEIVVMNCVTYSLNSYCRRPKTANMNPGITIIE